MSEIQIKTCVLRQVAGVDQYIPVEDAVIVEGENLYFGEFKLEHVKDGPSGSHERQICLPRASLKTLPLTSCHTGRVAPERGWKPISPELKQRCGERVFVSYRQYLDLLYS